MQLRPAGTDDIFQIRTLAHRIWNDHYPAIIGQQQVDYMLERMYAEGSLRQQMEEGQQFYLILSEGEPMGFVSVQPDGPGRYFLNKFYIDTTRQRSGVGRQVFDLLLNEYPDLRELRLQVNRQNYRAINFYFKMGFVIERVADFDIGDGYFMNDFIMLYKTV